MNLFYLWFTPGQKEKKTELKEAGLSRAYRLWIVTLINSTASKNTSYIKATTPIKMLLLKEPC